MARKYCWVFTLRHLEEVEDAVLDGDLARSNACYTVYGRETGAGGYEHYQGFIMWKTLKSFAQVKAVFTDQTVHIEYVKTTPAQAAEYCKKDGDFVETGVAPAGQGHRSDLEQIKARLDDNVAMVDIAHEFPGQYIRYARGIAQLALIIAKPRDFAPDVTVCWGASGTGKSRWAHNETPDAYYKAPDSTWWDGYSGQKNVIIDEFVPHESKMTRSYMLRLLNRYPMQVETKGGMVQFVATRIIITSNYDPQNWWTDLPEALIRRITLIKCFDQK